MKTISTIKSVIDNSTARPALDLIFLEASIVELIILHMDGKAPAFPGDQVIHDATVEALKNPRLRARAEAMTYSHLIRAKVGELIDTIAESN